MRKLLSIILAVCMLASGMCISSFAALTTEQIYSAYDFNNDNVVDLLDVRAVLRVSARIEAPAAGRDYDIDKSGSAEPDYEDVKMLLSIALGISTEGADVSNDEYTLSLFRNELNSVKTVKPGFTKKVTSQCASMKITTTNVPSLVPSLKVTDCEFSDYVYILEDALSSYSLLLGSSYKEMLAEMKQKAADYRKPVTTSNTIAPNIASHITDFPIRNLGRCCYLEIGDIKSITTTEGDGVVKRVVTLNNETIAGADYPLTTREKYSDTIYGKVFDIPSLKTTSDTTLDKVDFTNGKITLETDMITGVPVKVTYEYTYEYFATSIVESEDEMIMSTKTKIGIKEVYDINSAEVY